MDITSNEIIKTFLKIDNPNVQDKPYYSVNEDKNKLTLFDPVDKAPSDKSSDFEIDKIFLGKEETNSIYDEIFKNTINDSLKGISFSFINYGDSNSNKLKLLIGDYKNYNLSYNNIGLFPKYLHSLIKKAKTTEKNMEEKINLKISYFLVYDGFLIDLCNLRSKNKDINNFTEEKLFEGKYTIKNEENIIDLIKKVNVEGFKEEIHFLNQIFNLLNKIENNDENKNIFTKSYISIVVYTENKGKKAIINFLILNGSEYLYSGKAEKFKSLINNNNRNSIEGTKLALETQYTYETLLNLVKLKIYIDNNVDASNNKEIDLILNKNKQNSKLTTLLYNIYFNTKKMYFRILGTTIPNSGFYQNFKDTLIFLLDFHQIKTTYQNQLASSITNNIYSKLTNENNHLSKQNEHYNKIFDEDKKDNYIIDLKNKVNSYKKIVDDQKLNISKKDAKIAQLTKIYQEQINVMKKKFNFTGDINVLLSGDENTKEAKFIKNMKEAVENNIRNEGNLRLLQKKLEMKEEEIKKLKNKEQMIDANDTMIKYYISVQQINEEKNKNDKYINSLRNIIEKKKKKLGIKDKVIDKYKKEIENKNKILFNLPKCLKETYSNILADEKKNVTHEEGENNNFEDENNTVKSKSIETDSLYNKEMEKIKKDSQKQLDIMKLNYENIIKDKNIIIKQLEFDNEQFKLEKNRVINNYGEELVKLNKLLMSLISNYKRIYSSNISQKYSNISLNSKKEELDKIIISINKDVNFANFPLLHNFLLKTKQLDINQPFSFKNYKKVYSPITKSVKKEEKKEKGLENDFKSNIPVNNEQLFKVFKEETNDGKIIFTKEKLEEMSKEAIILHCININNKLNSIEKYLEKYIQYKKGFNVEEFEMGEKYKDQIIEELKNKIKKLSINLDEQTKINNQKVYVLNSQNRKIDKLQRDTIIYKNLLNFKKISASLIQPNKSTVCQSSIIEFNSINSNNNSISKNNRTLKKSSSLVNIGKSRQPLSQKVRRILKNQSKESRPISSKIKYFTSNK